MQLTSQATFNVPCKYLTRFGGVFNYEEYILQGYTTISGDTDLKPYEFKAGDKVLMGFISGIKNIGVIYGGFKHNARSSKINEKDGIAYTSEFNGLQTIINNEGEYLIKARLTPTNRKDLENPTKEQLPKPKYDTKIGGSFLLFDKEGSVILNDSSLTLPQYIKIEKPSGSLAIKSGKTYFILNKNQESQRLKSLTYENIADVSMNEYTAVHRLEATTSTTIESPKLAFGTKEIELLDHISKVIDAIGKLTVQTPSGMTAMINKSPQWGTVEDLKKKINSITGKI